MDLSNIVMNDGVEKALEKIGEGMKHLSPLLIAYRTGQIPCK
jgi:hypothetical protein